MKQKHNGQLPAASYEMYVGYQGFSGNQLYFNFEPIAFTIKEATSPQLPTITALLPLFERNE
ncbi:MAG: hypothetical protein KAH84_09160 [Thiomargarita sp.]|nr:hypothetical protein [Thiomargarita sp.]